MMDIEPGTIVRWYSHDGGWRWGKFVRVVHARRNKDGIKGEAKALVNRNGSEEKIPMREVKTWVRST